MSTPTKCPRRRLPNTLKDLDAVIKNAIDLLSLALHTVVGDT